MGEVVHPAGSAGGASADSVVRVRRSACHAPLSEVQAHPRAMNAAGLQGIHSTGRDGPPSSESRSQHSSCGSSKRFVRAVQIGCLLSPVSAATPLAAARVSDESLCSVMDSDVLLASREYTRLSADSHPREGLLVSRYARPLGFGAQRGAPWEGEVD
jgi:hypothetical protein